MWVISPTQYSPPFSLPHQPPTPGGCRICYGKREVNGSPPSIHTLGQQVQKLPGKHKILSTVNTATPDGRFWQGNDQRKNTSKPLATHSSVKIRPPSSHQFLCMPSPLTISSALKALRLSSLLTRLKGVFLWIADSWDCPLCWATLPLSGAHCSSFPKITQLPKVLHVSKQSSRPCCCSQQEPQLPEGFCTAKQTAYLLKFHFPLRTENHWRPTTEAQTLFQAGAASAEPLAKPLDDEATYVEGQMMPIPQQLCVWVYECIRVHMLGTTVLICPWDFAHTCIVPPLASVISTTSTCYFRGAYLRPPLRFSSLNIHSTQLQQRKR